MTPQANIAHYRITGRLGQGGMGEVFRATDTRLNREVAIKVIPDSFAQDPDRMARFEREAQVLAALNHPNIAAIYGLERNALVMELVEGPTLADRIEGGAVSAEEALAIARQMADALEAAHEKGIVHRDLKPANIKVTPGGQVKVLDFGLAKMAEPAHSSAHPANSPTMTQRQSPTIAGVIMGTAGYMAPEQARGTAVDKRADIWAFGVVLFEMLTGRPTFAGETVSDQLASVLKSDPDWKQLPADTPPSVQRLLRRCLERDRNRRLHDIADARLEIDAVDLAESGVALPATVARRSRAGVWMAVATVAILATAILGVNRFWRRPAEAAPLRFTIPLPPNLDLLPVINGSPILAPDGSALAFLATDGNLWVRRLTEGEAHPIAGVRGASCPFWSPDSRRIAFFADGKLKKVAVAGGPSEVICDAPEGRGGAWSARGEGQGVIVFAPMNRGVLYRVAASGGTPSAVTANEAGSTVLHHRQPVFLPDGRHFLYLSDKGVYVGDAEIQGAPAEAPLLMAAESGVWFAPPGYLLFLRDNVVMARSFDPERFVLEGDAFPVVQNVDSYPLRRTAELSVSQTGVLIWRENAGRNFELTWLDRKGKSMEAMENQAGLDRPAISPDGKRAVFMDSPTSATARLWLMDLGRKLAAPIAQTKAGNPIWASDAGRIAFAVNGSTVLGVRDLDRGQEQQLPGTGNNRQPLDWTRDGRYILFRQIDAATKADLWLYPMQGEQTPIPLLRGSANESGGRFSPDNRWLAYQSDESGVFEIYLTSFTAGQPSSGAKWRISTEGGIDPLWRRDGKELFYTAIGTDGRQTVMAVPISAAEALQAGRPVALFDLPAGSSYDVAPDGQRFLVARRPARFTARPFQITLNWLAIARQGR